MAVTYNKINWDEETPITVANLDRIDVGIDEVVTQSNSNEGRITNNEDDISNHEGRITTNEDDISTIQTNLNGIKFELAEEGTVTISGNGNSTVLIDITGNDRLFVSYSVQLTSTDFDIETYVSYSIRRGRTGVGSDFHGVRFSNEGSYQASVSYAIYRIV